MSAGILPESSEAFSPDSLPILDAAVTVPAPRVNLLPSEITEQRAMRRFGLALTGVVALVAVAVGGGHAYAGAGEGQARRDLAAAQSAQSRWVQQQQTLLPAQQTQTQIQAARAALTAAMGNEVLWSRYMDELRLRRPDGLRFKQVSISAPGTGGTGSSSSSSGSSTASSSGTVTAPNSTATSGAAVATLTISGVARTQPDVAALLDQLAQVKGFTNPYLTSTDAAANSNVLSFTVTATVTSDALSHRYSGGTNR